MVMAGWGCPPLTGRRSTSGARWRIPGTPGGRRVVAGDGRETVGVSLRRAFRVRLPAGAAVSDEYPAPRGPRGGLHGDRRQHLSHRLDAVATRLAKLVETSHRR